MSEDLNYGTLTGRLTNDAECRLLPSGTYAYSISVANKRRTKTADGWGDKTYYFDLTYYSKSTAIAQFLKKGLSVALTYELVDDRYLSRDGQNRKGIKLTARSLVWFGAASGQADGRRQERKAYSPVTEADAEAVSGRGQDANPSMEEFDDEQVPF